MPSDNAAAAVDVRALIARLEGASEGSRELDVLFHTWFLWRGAKVLCDWDGVFASSATVSQPAPAGARDA